MKRPWEISRRACLRGAGTMIGLPFLEAMAPGIKRARAAGVEAPKRLVFFVFTGGTPETYNFGGGEGLPGCLKPSTTGANYQITPLLEPLADLKQDILVISNLHNSIGVVGKGKYSGGDHQRSETALLTGVNPENADGPGEFGPTVVGISADQVAANALKQFTPGLPSIYLSNPTSQHLMCWSGATSRVNPIELPSKAFAEIFGDASVDPKELQKRLAFKKSVLHHAKENADILRRKLGKADQETLDKYLTSVHDLEGRIAASNTSSGQCSGGTAPTDNPDDLPTHWKQMLDLLALAFQCDRTRVATIQLYTHGMWPRWLGAPCNAYASWHDDVEHGAFVASMDGFGDGANRMEAYQKGAAWQIEQFAYLVRKMKETIEADGSGTLLDNSILACTSEISYGNGHTMHHLPVIVAGRGGGAVAPGRHIEVTEQPIANLWLSMLKAVGVPGTSFGNGHQALTLT